MENRLVNKGEWQNKNRKQSKPKTQQTTTSAMMTSTTKRGSAQVEGRTAYIRQGDLLSSPLYTRAPRTNFKRHSLSVAAFSRQRHRPRCVVIVIVSFT